MSGLGVGVIGVGTLGKRHAENLRFLIPEARLVAVADADGKRAAQVAAELGVEHSYDRIEGLLARNDLHAVVIASPSKFHASATEAAAAAGKHVFCEKPAGLTIEDAEAAMKMVAKAGVQLQIGFMRRYDPAYATAKKRIEAGEIGDPVIFKSLGRDRQPPPLSFFQSGINGTLFADSAIHDFDLARWLMRDEVSEVQAVAGAVTCPELVKFGDVDSCLVNLRFTRGGIGNVEAFRQSRYGYDIRTEIVGTQGTLQIGYLRQTAALVLTASGAAYDVVDHWLVRFREAYLNELRDFVQAILAGGPVKVCGEDGWQALKVSLAAERSYRESRSISLDGAASAPRTGT